MGSSIILISVLVLLVCCDSIRASKHLAKREAGDDELPPMGNLCEFVKCSGRAKCVLRNGVPKCVDATSGQEYCPFPTPCGGTREYCSLDGRTFKSLESMAYYSCRENKPMGVKYAGPCKGDWFPECSEEGLCGHVDLIKCCCHLHGKIPKCYDKGQWRCPERTKFLLLREVCASNGKTYSHPTKVLEVSCVSKTPLEILYRGRCKKESKDRDLDDE